MCDKKPSWAPFQLSLSQVFLAPTTILLSSCGLKVITIWRRTRSHSPGLDARGAPGVVPIRQKGPGVPCLPAALTILRLHKKMGILWGCRKPIRKLLAHVLGDSWLLRCPPTTDIAAGNLAPCSYKEILKLGTATLEYQGSLCIYRQVVHSLNGYDAETTFMSFTHGWSWPPTWVSKILSQKDPKVLMNNLSLKLSSFKRNIL